MDETLVRIAPALVVVHLGPFREELSVNSMEIVDENIIDNLVFRLFSERRLTTSELSMNLYCIKDAQAKHTYFTFEPHREKTGFCLCENKGADQLRGNREADQRLCFRYSDSTIPLLLKSEISSF